MNLDSLTKWATGVVLAAACSGHLGDLQLWVWKAQAELLRESRTSTWGSPKFWPTKELVKSQFSPAQAIRNNYEFENSSNNRPKANFGLGSL